MLHRLSHSALVAAALLAASPLAAQQQGELALMGTIPIYWGERGDLAELLASEGGHWARPVIEEQYRLHPLDYLSAEALRGHSRLLLAQPRGLTAEENVALDTWVRGGGLLLLFADPLMTGHSRFALGDRRRPQDVALLSPILAHWGLEMRFDSDQAAGRRGGGVSVPGGFAVEQAGELVALAEGGPCTALSDGIIAECSLGQGRVLVVADAALLNSDPAEEGVSAALSGLLAWIFGIPVPQSAH